MEHANDNGIEAGHAHRQHHHHHSHGVLGDDHLRGALLPIVDNEISANDDTMPPNPYDDGLFIEPAGDYDIVYGDYNSTMEDSTGKRPYIRLTSTLPNVTRASGGEIRLKCEAAGSPLPITFTWLKNNAPVEKSRRTKFRNKDYFSKLIITDLDVLDSGYYQCTAHNVAGAVNTTSVLRVNAHSKVPVKTKTKSHHSSDDYDDDYDNYDDSSMDRGRLPSDEEKDLFRVPGNAGGMGYIPFGPSGGQDRWLDGLSLRVGDCILYQGDACRNFLTGKHILVTSESREAMYDIDRELRAAMMFIQNIPSLSNECKRYSHAVACYHMYKVCDVPTSSSKVLSLCRKDCDSLKDEVCPLGFSMAAQHELIGDGPKALLPQCTTLSPNAHRCLRVLEPPQPPPALIPPVQPVEEKPQEWCFSTIGSSYRGPVSVTKSGQRCLPWTEARDPLVTPVQYPDLVYARNHCRNPDGSHSGPWCFTTPHGNRELCDIPRCPAGSQTGLLDNLNSTWTSMSAQWQLAALSGLGGFAIILLLLLLCCCCRKKRASSTTSSSLKKSSNTYAGQSCNGSTIVGSSGINSGYAKKYPNPNAYEMNALLGSGGYGAPPMGPPGGYMVPGFQQYSPPTTEPPVEPFQIREISQHQLRIEKALGEGPVIAAYVGEFESERGILPVAIKMIKQGSSRIESAAFENDIKTLANIDHPNVIRLLGVAYLERQQLSAVFDFSCHGNLHAFLKVREPVAIENDEKERLRNFEDFFRIGGQIAAGMDYLAKSGVVHRDLAARNCLVTDQQVIKIADFASMQQQYDIDYYNISPRSRVPLRWLSREALQENYSVASDVYAFGVTLWEIYTYGRQPYEGFHDDEVVKMISMHDVLPSPAGCPPNVYSVMIETWSENPDRRPSFGELYSRFQKWSLAGAGQFFMMGNRAASTHSGSNSYQSRSPKPPRHYTTSTGLPPAAPDSLMRFQNFAAYVENTASNANNMNSNMNNNNNNNNFYAYSEESSSDDNE